MYIFTYACFQLSCVVLFLLVWYNQVVLSAHYQADQDIVEEYGDIEDRQYDIGGPCAATVSSHHHQTNTTTVW